MGLVGRATYDYRSKYMAEVNIGYNGSENFAPGKRYGLFPAGSIGWVVTEEPFMEDLKQYVNYLKVRASYGIVGNDNTQNRRFMYIDDPYYLNGSVIISVQTLVTRVVPMKVLNLTLMLLGKKHINKISESICMCLMIA